MDHEHMIVKVTDKEAELRERKAKLLRQGEMYRVGIVQSRAYVRDLSRPEAIIQNAIEHAGYALRSRIDGMLAPTGITVAAVMPYAATVFAFIARRRLIKPALAVVAVAAGLAWFVRERRARRAY